MEKTWDYRLMLFVLESIEFAVSRVAVGGELVDDT